MLKSNKEDIHVEFKAINLSSSARVLIVGGGKAGLIKLRSFQNKGFAVDVMSPDFCDEIVDMSRSFENVKLIKSKYSCEILKKYNVVIIVTNDENMNERLRSDCEKLKKVYLYGPDFKKGNFSVPMEVESRNIRLSVGTAKGSPYTSRFLAEKLHSFLEEYDDFVEYSSGIRYKIKDKRKKREIMEFVNTDDFYFFYEKGKADFVLRLFYGGDFFEHNSGN